MTDVGGWGSWAAGVRTGSARGDADDDHLKSNDLRGKSITVLLFEKRLEFPLTFLLSLLTWSILLAIAEEAAFS